MHVWEWRRGFIDQEPPPLAYFEPWSGEGVFARVIIWTPPPYGQAQHRCVSADLLPIPDTRPASCMLYTKVP